MRMTIQERKDLCFATLDEVAIELGVSKQRAAQIEKKALTKVRVLFHDAGLDDTALRELARLED